MTRSPYFTNSGNVIRTSLPARIVIHMIPARAPIGVRFAPSAVPAQSEGHRARPRAASRTSVRRGWRSCPRRFTLVGWHTRSEMLMCGSIGAGGGDDKGTILRGAPVMAACGVVR